MSWTPPLSYLILLQKAVEAGYIPTERQKEWLQEMPESKNKSDSGRGVVNVHSS